MLERAFSDQVIKKLRAEFPGLWRKQPASRFGVAGVADIIGCVNGQYIEIELKQPGKYSSAFLGCTKLQIEHGLDVQNSGGIWIAGDDWDEIKDELGTILLRLYYMT
jgi:hypothetical protein